MNKMIPMILCTAALVGCRTPVTPETSWADYGRYYSPTGETAVQPQLPAEIREVKSSQANASIAALQEQGYVLLGKFLINDDTEITYNAVAALAQKLNAGVAVWTRENTIGDHSALPNPAINIDGIDTVQMTLMNADRPDATKMDQLISHTHTIWMLGKKN